MIKGLLAISVFAPWTVWFGIAQHHQLPDSRSLNDPASTVDSSEQAPSTVAQNSTQKTRLRTAKPKGTFETYRGATKLKRVEIKVKNVGETKAENVSIQVTSPTGNTFEASGPNSIEARSNAMYTAYPGEYVTSSKRIKVEASCSNCYK